MVRLMPSRSSEELEPSTPSESANRFICSSVFSRYRSILGSARSDPARLSSALHDSGRFGAAELDSAQHGPTRSC